MTARKAIWIHGASGTPNYNAEEDRMLLAGIFGGRNFESISPGIGAIGTGHGVLSFSSMAVTANGTPNNQVFVAPGNCAIRGTQENDQGVYLCGNDGTVSLTVSAAHASLDRKDLVVARVKDNAYPALTGDVWELAIITGTPAGSPADPTVTEDTLVLARLLVRDATEAGGTIIRSQDITDLRPHARTTGGITPVSTLSAWPNPQAFDVVWAIDTSTLHMAKPGGGWFRLGIDFDATWVSYTPTLDNTTLGNGTKWGRYLKLGRTVVVEAGFQYGSTSVLAGNIGISLPFTSVFPSGQLEWAFGARAFQVPEGVYFGGLGISHVPNPSKVHLFATAGQTPWTAGGPPFAWNSGDGMTMFGVFETAG